MESQMIKTIVKKEKKPILTASDARALMKRDPFTRINAVCADVARVIEFAAEDDKTAANIWVTSLTQDEQAVLVSLLESLGYEVETVPHGCGPHAMKRVIWDTDPLGATKSWYDLKSV
jgi:hypothetical protein